MRTSITVFVEGEYWFYLKLQPVYFTHVMFTFFFVLLKEQNPLHFAVED